MKNIKLIFLALFLITGCLDSNTKGDLVFEDPTEVTDREPQNPQDPQDPTPPVQVITFEDFEKEILQPFRCQTCHSNWASDLQGILSRIKPGEPFSSPMYLRMENGSMPLGGPQLNKDQLEYVERFIRQLEESR